jgi:hypothetical protein
MSRLVATLALLVILNACGWGETQEQVAKPPTEQVQHWISSYCQLQRGQTRAEAIEIMGNPTSESAGKGNAIASLYWGQNSGQESYGFSAFLDTDGLVSDFLASYEGFGQFNLDEPPCDKNR